MAWKPPRVTYLQHASDLITWLPPSMLFRQAEAWALVAAPERWTSDHTGRLRAQLRD